VGRENDEVGLFWSELTDTEYGSWLIPRVHGGCCHEGEDEGKGEYGAADQDIEALVNCQLFLRRYKRNRTGFKVDISPSKRLDHIIVRGPFSGFSRTFFKRITPHLGKTPYPFHIPSRKKFKQQNNEGIRYSLPE
jgi:hypothetical protein